MEGGWERRRRFPPLTMALIALNVAAFLAEIWIIRHAKFDLEKYGALSLNGLRHGYFWQFLSFQFLHGGWIHLLLNCWAIFVFGPPLEAMLGRVRFTILYLVSGACGGALQVLTWFFDRGHFAHEVVGASAGVFGLVSAFTQLFPDARMTVLLFFVIPLRMTANRMLTLAAIITVVGIMFPNWLLGAHVAHMAHLGGLISGLIFIRLFGRRFRP